VNRYAQPGGPNPDQLRQLACGLARTIPIVGVTLSAYDPAFDAKGEVPPIVGQLLGDFLAALERI
jgi:arginase